MDDGRLLYAVGNGESTQAYDHSDSVLSLSPRLDLVDSFSPAQWASDNEADLDLGSMGPALVGDHVLAVGKSGVGYVLDAARLGGVGGQLTAQPICAAYGGSAVDGSTVYLPCSDGTRAVSIDAGGAITPRWTATVPANGPPVLGGGAVWVTDYHRGVLYALDPDRVPRARCRRTPALRIPVPGRRPRLPRHHEWSQRDHRYLTIVHP